VQFGVDVTVIQPVDLYNCIIEDHAFIGPFVEIQENARIGVHTRIQSHTFICEGVSIGKSCFVAHGVMFINDTFSTGGPAGDKTKWKPTLVGDRVSIGSNATIMPVTICSDAVIGAGAVVIRDIVVPGFYAGNPARLLKELNK